MASMMKCCIVDLPQDFLHDLLGLPFGASIHRIWVNNETEPPTLRVFIEGLGAFIPNGGKAPTARVVVTTRQVHTICWDPLDLEETN